MWSRLIGDIHNGAQCKSAHVVKMTCIDGYIASWKNQKSCLLFKNTLITVNEVTKLLLLPLCFD